MAIRARARDLEQRHAPAGREHHGRRVLVVRRDVDGAHGAGARDALDGVDVDAARVDGDGDERAPGEPERAPRRAIAERLDDDDVARVKERSRDEVERHLAPARHEDVVGAGGDPARRPRASRRARRAGAGGRADRRSRGRRGSARAARGDTRAPGRRRGRGARRAAPPRRERTRGSGVAAGCSTRASKSNPARAGISARATAAREKGRGARSGSSCETNVPRARAVVIQPSAASSR